MMSHRFFFRKIHLLIKVFILVTQRSTNLADPVGVVASGDSSSAVDRRVLRVPVAWLIAATIVCAAFDLVRTSGILRSLRLGRSVVGLGCWTMTKGGVDIVAKLVGRTGGGGGGGSSGGSMTSSCSESLVSGITTSLICGGWLGCSSSLVSLLSPVSRLRDLFGTPATTKLDKEPIGVTHPLRAWLKNGVGMTCCPAEIRRWTSGLMGIGRGEMERVGLAARSPAEPLNRIRFCHWPGPDCGCCRGDRLGLGLRWAQLGETALRWFLKFQKEIKTNKHSSQLTGYFTHVINTVWTDATITSTHKS